MENMKQAENPGKVICLHHNDLDGHCSAAIVDRFFKVNVNFFPMDYYREIPFDDMPKCKVVIVDFAPNKVEDFEKIIQLAEVVIWIDHHKTSLEKYQNLSHLPGLRVDGTAACELTWKYFFEGVTPYAVKLMGDYDVWKFAYGKHTRFFQAGMRLEDTRPFNHKLWDDLLDDDPPLVEKIISNGEIITKYNELSWERSLRAIGYHTTLNGLNCIACNVQGSSDVFKSMKGEGIDAFIVYGHNGKNFKCSIYRKNSAIDVSEVAMRYGGGGHAGASGFSCDELPFQFEGRLAKEEFGKEPL